MSYVAYANTGALIKRSIAELVRAGCRIERVAHDPPAVTFRSPEGEPNALRVDGAGCTLVGPAGLLRFHTLDAALAAATTPVVGAAS